MKKTGKVLSLVLSLALVASSLTATFASAATESATVTLNSDTVYLSNNGAAGATMKADLSSFLTGTGIKEAKSASGVDLKANGTITLKEIAVVSGSSLITVDTVSPTSVVLADSSKTGSALVAARYTGTYTKADGTTANVSSVANIKVVIYAKDMLKIGKDGTGTTGGSVPEDLETLPKNEATDNVITGAIYKLAPTDDDNALAVWTAQPVATTATDTVFKVTSDNAGAAEADGTNNFTLTTKAPAVANSNVKVSATLASGNPVTATTKIENRVAVAYTGGAFIGGYQGKLYISDAALTKDNFSTAHKEVIDNVDAVYNAGNVTINAGSVKKLTATGALTVNMGSVVEATAVGATVYNGSVGKLTSTGIVTVNGGSVTTIDAAAQTVTVNATVAKIPASVGTVTANELTVGNATTTLADTKVVKATAATINLNGTKASIGTVDTNKVASVINYDGSYTGAGVAYANVSAEALPAVTVAAGSEVNYAKDISLGTLTVNGKMTFGAQANIAGVTGAGTGTVVFVPAKLYTTGDIQNVMLQVAGGKVTAGQTLFTAPLYTVNEAGITGKGFTVKKESGAKLDTFKVDEVNFYGIEFTTTSDKIVQGETKTYTATAYPVGKALPDGATIKLTFDGSDDYFSFKDNGNGTATVKALKYEKTFTSLNKGTITATLYDSNGYEMYSYTAPTCALTIIEKAEQNFISDTTGTYNMKVGQNYTFKITSSDGSVPKFVVASNGATVAPYTKSGNNYYFKVTGANTGDFGVYVGNRVCVLHITSGVTCDTKTVTIANGKTYQFKVTAPKAPAFVVAGVGTVKPVKVEGNNYFYKVMNDGAAGQYGVYINGARMAIITCTK